MKVVLLACVIAGLQFAHAGKPKVCRMKKGRMVYNFAGESAINMFAPCKAKYLSGLKCGKYIVSMSGGNVIDYHGKIMFNNIFLRIVNNDKEDPEYEKIWSGITNIRIAKRFISGHKKQDLPFNDAFGSVGFGYCDIFGTSKDVKKTAKGVMDGESGGSFTIKALSGDFELTYNLINENRGDNRFVTSGFIFKCFADDVVSKPYPQQICGDMEKGVMDARMKELGFKDLDHTFMFDVLNASTNQANYRNNSNLGFESERGLNSSCGRLANVMERRCSAEQRVRALKMCNPIVTNTKLRECLATTLDTPLPGDILWYCTEFVCNGFKSHHYCPKLAHALHKCPRVTSDPYDDELKDLTDKVRASCGEDYPYVTKEEIRAG